MWLANDCAFQGRLSEALAGARHAQELEPLSLTFAANVGPKLHVIRDYASALAQLTPLLDAAPEFALARNHLARVLLVSGSPDKAIAVLGGTPSRARRTGEHRAAPKPPPVSGSLLPRRFGGWRREVHRASVSVAMGTIDAALGQRDLALDAVERGLRDGSQMISFMNVEPGFDPIKDELRFRAVSRAIGLAEPCFDALTRSSAGVRKYRASVPPRNPRWIGETPRGCRRYRADCDPR